MINSKGTARRHWRGIAVVTGLAAVCGAALLGSVGNAVGGGGAQTFCQGVVKPKSKKHPGVDATYQFTCNEAIRGYSVLTNKVFDFFGVETTVVGPPNIVAAESSQIQCEGAVPSNGFGCGIPNRNNGGATTTFPGRNADCQGISCSKKLSAGAYLLGELGFQTSPCESLGAGKAGKTKIWLTVVTEPLIASSVPPAANAPAGTPNSNQYQTGIYSSAPISLKVKGWGKKTCPKPKGDSKNKK